MRNIKLGVMFVAMMLVASLVCADVIATWDVVNAKNGRATGTSFIPDITTKHMLINGVISTKTGMGAYGWTSGDIASTEQFYDFDVNVNKDVGYIATNLTLGFSGTVGKWELRSSNDGYTSILATLTDASNGIFTMDFDDFNLTNNTTFRLYGYGNTELSGISGLSENVTLNGRAIPEPITMVLVLITGLGLWIVQRFRT